MLNSANSINYSLNQDEDSDDLDLDDFDSQISDEDDADLRDQVFNRMRIKAMNIRENKDQVQSVLKRQETFSSPDIKGKDLYEVKQKDQSSKFNFSLEQTVMALLKFVQGLVGN